MPATGDENVSDCKTAWEYYWESAEITDQERERDILEQMDNILLFSGLYAAFLSAFLIDTLGRLQEDPIETTRDILIHQTRMMRNATLGPYQPLPFEPPAYIGLVNILLFASLATTLVAAFISMLIKGWIREFDRGLKSILVMKDRAVIREYRAQGLERYRLPQIVALLQLLIYISLILFFCGLITLLLFIHRPSAIAITVIMVVGVLFYCITLSVSILDASAPFKSPVSRFGFYIFHRTWVSMVDWYVKWVYFSTQPRVPRWIVGPMAKVLLWKPHMDRDLVKFDHSRCFDLDSYHISRWAQVMERTVLDTVYRLPGATGSRLLAVQQSLVTAGGNCMYQGRDDVHFTMLESFVGVKFSLDQARAIATLLVQPVDKTFPMLHEAALSLLKTSSDPWDKTLAILLTMDVTGLGIIDELVDTATSALQPGRFMLSRIVIILNVLRHYRYYNLNLEETHMMVAAARICNVVLIHQEPSIIELLFIFACVKELETRSDSIHNKLLDGKLFSHLHDDAALMDLFLVLDSFTGVIREFRKTDELARPYAAFAIHFLICLRQASPVVYWKIMGQVNSGEVREWAGDVSERHTRHVAFIILHSRGISVGEDTHLDRDVVSDIEIQLYDQSIGPGTVDIDFPLLEVVYSDAKDRHRPEGPFPDFENVWLAMHVQTADERQHLPIPAEQIQWIDHPISEVIALRRLSTYDDLTRAPEPTFINLFLHSKSFEVLLPTLQSHLSRLREPGVDSHAPIPPSNATSHDELPNLQLNALKILFGPDLAPNQLLSFWLIVCPLCDAQWADFPHIWRFAFVESFFSIIDEGPNSTTTGYLGIKWMEAVWEKVLRPRIKTVVVESVEFYWPGVEGGEWNKDEGVLLYWKRRRDQEEHGKRKGARKGELDQSMPKVLETLAKLLEEASIHGLVTVGLANAVSRSPLFDDDYLQQDQGSVGRIEAIIGPFLVPLPPTPPIEVIKPPEGDTEDGDRSDN